MRKVFLVELTDRSRAEIDSVDAEYQPDSIHAVSFTTVPLVGSMRKVFDSVNAEC